MNSSAARSLPWPVWRHSFAAERDLIVLRCCRRLVGDGERGVSGPDRPALGRAPKAVRVDDHSILDSGDDLRRRRLLERGEVAEEAEFAGLEGGLQVVKRVGKDARAPHGQEEAGQETQRVPSAKGAPGRRSGHADDDAVLARYGARHQADLGARCLGSAAIVRKVSAAP